MKWLSKTCFTLFVVTWFLDVASDIKINYIFWLVPGMLAIAFALAGGARRMKSDNSTDRKRRQSIFKDNYNNIDK